MTLVRAGLVAGLLLILACPAITIAGAMPTDQPHAIQPRIWLTPALLAAIKLKVATNDRDWLNIKADADRMLKQSMPHFTITGATNTNPVEFTLREIVPWTGNAPLFIAGGTGAWAAVNVPGDRPSAVAATRTGVHTFSVPIDARSFPKFQGQALVLFFSEGGLSGYGYQGSDWQVAMQTLGLAYQVSSDPAYASKGIELLDYIASLGAAHMLAPESIDSGFPSRSTVLALGIGYDWLRDRMTMEEKTQVVAALNVWYDWFKRAAYGNNGPVYSNYFGGHVLGFGVAALATESENPRGKEIVADIRKLFARFVVPAFATGGFAGGYPVEAYVYGTNHFQRLLYYMLAVKSATGEDLFTDSSYADKMAQSLIYNLKPNRWQVPDEGDYSGDFTGVLQSALPVVLSHVLAGKKEGEWMQFLVQHLAAAPVGGRVADSFTPLLFYDALRPSSDYRLTLPNWYHSQGDEHLYRRSSWQDDAVWTSFMGGAANWSGHQSRAAGHVAIQRGSDYLLVNSGQWKGIAGYGGTPQAFDSRSWRSNTLYFNDLGEYLFSGPDYIGGQGYWGINTAITTAGAADYAYMNSDLTTSYSIGDHKPFAARSLRYFNRAFVSLGSGIVVLFDRMQFSKQGYIAKLYFHLNPTGGPPTINGNTAAYRIGRSSLFIKAVLPGASSMRLDNDPVSDGDSRPITRRIEIPVAATGTAHNLTVLIAAAAATSEMPDTQAIRSTKGNMLGAMILDNDTRRVVLFSADGTSQSEVDYPAPFPIDQRSEHVVTDLIPGTAYSVLLNGAPIAAVTASSQGIASFESKSGGAFALKRTH